MQKYQSNQNNASLCEGDVISGFYQKSGWCTNEYSKTVCSPNGDINTLIYTEKGCKGNVANTLPIPSNVCNDAFTMKCVDTIGEIPSNSFIEVTTDGLCQDDPNWKHQVNSVSYSVLDVCVGRQEGSLKLTCNSSLPVFNIYNSTDSCPGEAVGYELFSVPICTSEKPTFAYC